MPLTVLSEHDVSRVLHSLNGQDIRDIQQSLADALHQGHFAVCCGGYRCVNATFLR